MGRRKPLEPPKPLFHRTREPEARWVYERCYEMWKNRNWRGDENTMWPQGEVCSFTRGLQRFICKRSIQTQDYEFTMELESGTYTVKKVGADYMWAGSFGLPRIPADDEMIEIKLSV
jgi:hypothetical protein